MCYMASSSPGTCDPSTSAGLICLVPHVMCQATPGGNPALANSTTGGSEVASEPATMEFHHATNRSRDLRLGPKPPGPHFLLLPKSGEPCGYGPLCHTLLFSGTLPPWPRSQPPLQEAVEVLVLLRLCVCSANQVPSPARAAIPLLSLLNSQRHLVCEFVCQG